MQPCTLPQLGAGKDDLHPSYLVGDMAHNGAVWELVARECHLSKDCLVRWLLEAAHKPVPAGMCPKRGDVVEVQGE